MRLGLCPALLCLRHLPLCTWPVAKARISTAHLCDLSHLWGRVTRVVTKRAATTRGCQTTREAHHSVLEDRSHKPRCGHTTPWRLQTGASCLSQLVGSARVLSFLDIWPLLSSPLAIHSRVSREDFSCSIRTAVLLHWATLVNLF